MLLRRGLLAVVVAACAVAAVIACSRRAPTRDGEHAAGATTLRSAELSPAGHDDPNAPLGCATLRDVARSELVHVEGRTLFYADGAAGLTVVDVADAARPHVLATVRFVGTPIALFVRDGTAWLVFVDWDSHFATGVETVIRAVDVRDPRSPRILGDEPRDGTARDAKLVGDVLYVLRRERGHAAVESFGLRNGKLRSLATLDLAGVPAQLAASASGLAVVTLPTDDRAAVWWVDLPLDHRGGLVLRESVTVPGTVATWERGDASILAADEDQLVRLVTCAARACEPRGGVSLRTIDFAAVAPAARVPSLRLTDRGGLPVTRFTDGRLYVAEPAKKQADTSTLQVVKTDTRTPAVVARVPVRGQLSSLVVHDTSLVAIGTVGAPESAVRVIVHDIDVATAAAPRVRSTVVFGSDWTWSVALDDERAVSFDASGRTLALPFTMWRSADRRYVTGAELVHLGGREGTTASALRTDAYVERVTFIDEHLVAVGPDHLQTVDYPNASEPPAGQQ